MRSLRLLALLAMIPVWLASQAFAQGPTITAVNVKDTGCYYKVGVTTNPCNIAPGMTLIIVGSNFGKTPGGVGLCDCPAMTILKWSPTRVSGIVNSATPNSSLVLETVGGGFSNLIPYAALAPVITSIVVGNCTYVPNESAALCLITPGTQVTINGSYFGPGTNGGSVSLCDCAAPTIDSWDPDWLASPSPFNNQIVITANVAVCGSTIHVFVDMMTSNFVPYTAC